MFDLPRRGFLGSLIASVTGLFIRKPAATAASQEWLKTKTFVLREASQFRIVAGTRVNELDMRELFQLSSQRFESRVNATRVMLDDGTSVWDVEIIFDPKPHVVHIVESDAKIRQPWPKNPHRSESEDDAAFPATWLENKLRSEIDHV